MQHITFTHVDAVTRVPVTIEPAPNGPAYPEGAVFGFALESQYPTACPTFYGWTEGETDTAGILSVITPEEYGEAEAAEVEARAILAAPKPVFVYKLDLFERTTNAEAEAILAAMDAQPARIRMIFNAAQSFRQDHELWPLLTGAATQLFGADRAAELLAPSA